MYCINCAATSPDQSAFCSQCGNILDAAGGGQSGMQATQSVAPASAGWPSRGQLPQSYGNLPPAEGNQAQPNGNGPQLNENLPALNGSGPRPDGYQPRHYENRAQPNGNSIPLRRNQPQLNGNPPWGNQAPSNRNPPWGNQAQPYGNQQPLPSGYQPQPNGGQPWGNQPSGNRLPPNGSQPWGNQPWGNQPPPYAYPSQASAAPPSPSARRHHLGVIAAFTAIVVLAFLGVTGWQKHWPPGVFGHKAAPALAWSAAQASLPSGEVEGANQYAFLQGVSCPSAGRCVAVGGYLATSGSGVTSDGLAETLSDGTWTPVRVRDLTASQGLVALIGVSCPADGSCVSVGYRTNRKATVASPVIQVLTGGDWTAATPVLPPDADQSKWASLNDVSCPAPTVCVATGRYTDQDGNSEGLLDTFSGGTWTAAQAPLPADADPGNGSTRALTFLTDVACTAVGTCVASGQYTDSAGNTQGVIETLSGGTWTAAQAPLPSDAAADAQLAALWTISCQAPGSCLAGGHYTGQNGQPRFLIDTLSAGKWTATGVGLPAGAAADQKWTQNQATTIEGLACQAAGSCVATASYLASSGAILPAISTLSDGTWHTVSVPLPGGAAEAAKQFAYPTLVSCPALGSCFTVGSYTASDASVQPLIETAAPEQG